MAYLLMHAELDAAIVSGARRGKQFTYALFDERAPRARRLARKDALGELARRYFATRAPATVHDLAKWSGLTIAEARTALEAAAPELRATELDGVTYFGQASSPRPRPAEPARTCSRSTTSTSRRTATAAPSARLRSGSALVGMGAALAYVVVVDGWIVGTWQRTFVKNSVKIELAPFRKWKSAGQGERGAFTRFLGADLVLDLKIRN